VFETQKRKKKRSSGDIWLRLGKKASIQVKGAITGCGGGGGFLGGGFKKKIIGIVRFRKNNKGKKRKFKKFIQGRGVIVAGECKKKRRKKRNK